eukprot:13698177-Ditylum_brightwellii.AAC.1
MTWFQGMKLITAREDQVGVLRHYASNVKWQVLAKTCMGFSPSPIYRSNTLASIPNGTEVHPQLEFQID